MNLYRDGRDSVAWHRDKIPVANPHPLVGILSLGSQRKFLVRPYGGGPFVYQEARSLPQFDGNYPVIGSWLVNGYACGIGIREDRSPITLNTSRFVPHVFSP